MTEHMMRVAGRYRDGDLAKGINVDEEGNLITRDAVFSKGIFNQISESGTSEEIDVTKFNSVFLQTAGQFKANVKIQGYLRKGVWVDLPIVSNEGMSVNSIGDAGLFSVSTSNVLKLRVTVDWISGTFISVELMGSSTNVDTKHVYVTKTKANNMIHKISDTFIIGRNKVFYGALTRGYSGLLDSSSVEFSDYERKAIYIKNNTDADVQISGFRIFLGSEYSTGYFGFTSTDILIEKDGGVGVVSSSDYPRLTDPFHGITIEVTALKAPSTGTLDIQFWGGN